MEIIGYSERGAMNALFYGMALNNDEAAMKEFLKLAEIPDWNIYSNFKLYMEFSLSDFGDPDLVIKANNGERSVVIFVEAKVSDCSSYSLNKAFKTHVDNIGKQEFVDGETSNLFFQLRLKNRFFKTRKEIPRSEEKYERNVNKSNEDFDKIAMTRKKGEYVYYRSIGNNPVVRRFVDEIRNCQSALYIAIIPEKDKIEDNIEEYNKVEEELGGIYFITWKKIFKNQTLEKHVKQTIEFNEGPDPLTVSKKLKNQILNTPITEMK